MNDRLRLMFGDHDDAAAAIVELLRARGGKVALVESDFRHGPLAELDAVAFAVALDELRTAKRIEVRRRDRYLIIREAR
jgi:hypothetical protein